MKNIFLRLTFMLSICLGVTNAQNLWQAMPNSEDFFDMRYIYQDTSNGILYVGLHSKVVGGDTVNYIAYWNGVKWAAMDKGAVNANYVSAIYNYHNTIYAAGPFWTQSGSPGTGIMKWNGATWETVGYGLCEGTNKSFGSEGAVLALTEIDDTMYALGIYDTIGCLPGNGIATWDGSAWKTVHDFPNTHPSGIPLIIAACTLNNQLYVTGGFYSPDSSGNEIAYFNGSEWHTVGGGLYGGLTVPFDMVTYMDKVYVAGRFTEADGNPGNNIASWDGTQWNDLAGGTDGQIFDLLIYHDKLYAFGGFWHAGGVPASAHMACWDGSKWCGIMSNFIMNGISHAGIYNDTILIGGGFILVQGNDTIRNFAKFLGGDYVDTCSAATAVSEINETNFSINANPGNSQIEITLPNNNHEQNLKIINTLGQVMKQREFSSNQILIDISDLPAGVYLVALLTESYGQNEKEKAVKKFVKQ